MNTPDCRGCGADRRGLTLVETLVALGIIAMLAGLLLPAVQGARESAAAARCKSNLRQIGLAVHAYHDLHDVFAAPWGMRDWSVPTVVPRQYSLFSQVLPYLDQRVLFDAVNFDVPLSDPELHPNAIPEWAWAANATVLRTRLDILLCPSDGGGIDGDTAGASYRVNLGTDRWYFSTDGPFMNKFAPTSFASIRDGASNTVGFSEKLRGRGEGRPDNRVDMIVGGLGWPHTPEESLAECLRGARVPVTTYHTGGSCWFVGALSQTNYNHSIGPNAAIADCVLPLTNPICGHVGARSDHPGGVHALFVDGSCRFVKDSVGLEIWRALGSRAGVEAVAVPE